MSKRAGPDAPDRERAGDEPNGAAIPISGGRPGWVRAAASPRGGSGQVGVAAASGGGPPAGAGCPLPPAARRGRIDALEARPGRVRLRPAVDTDDSPRAKKRGTPDAARNEPFSDGTPRSSHDQPAEFSSKPARRHCAACRGPGASPPNPGSPPNGRETFDVIVIGGGLAAFAAGLSALGAASA